MINRILGLLLLLASVMGAQAKDLKITLSNGSEKGIVGVQKLTFANGDVIATTEGGDVVTTAIAQVKNIVFGTTGIKAVDAQEAGVNIYPAIATCSLRVEGIEKVSDVDIYSINGALVLSTKVDNGGEIDVSGLATSTYIVRVGNAVTKFVKQ